MSDQFFPGLFCGFIFSAAFVCLFGDETSYYHEHLIAAEACSKNDGYNKIHSHQTANSIKVYCNDGAQFTTKATEK